jgi:stage II sporulation protein D
VIGLVVVTACAGGRPPTGATPPTIAMPGELRVRMGDRVRTVALESYVAGTTLAELSPIGETAETARRVLEVQSIITRTYAVSHLGRHKTEGFDLCDTTHCQVYEPSRLTTSRFAAAAQGAATRTAGQVLLFGGRAAEALFHADCGGHTADAHDVWGGTQVSYLRGLPDELPGGIHRQWTFSVSATTLLAALNADPRTVIGRSLDEVRVATRDASGRAAEIDLRGETTRRVRGDLFRAVLSARLGVQSIRSTRMSVERKGMQFVFAGTGYGHGVGLCQVGATARIRRGETLEHVLGVYYPGSRLAKVR